jgi:hypothetical protein
MVKHNDCKDNIMNLTLNVNSFKDTDFSYITEELINDIGNYIYLETMDNKILNDIDKSLILFDEIIILFDEMINLLEKLHFCIDNEENHNLKILLIFPGIKKLIYEYLILEINSDTNKIVWKSVKYKDLINLLLDHLLMLNIRLNNENYNKFINFLKNNLIINSENSKKLKPMINKKLSDMYINFNNKQNKCQREVKTNIKEKINEYLNYRKVECRLSNGYDPDILESNNYDI